LAVPDSPEPRTLRIDISVRTMLVVLAVMLGAWLVVQLGAVLLLCVFALVLVGTLNPLLGWFQRRGIHRMLGLALTLLALLVAVSLVLLLSVPALIQQLLTIIEDAPEHRENVAHWLEQQPLTEPLAHSLRELGADSLLTGAGERLFELSSNVILGIGYAATTVVLAIYLLADGQRALGVVYALVPRDYHLRLARIIVQLEIIVGGYVRGQLLTSAAIFIFAFALLTVCGVENALALAVFAGLTDVIPFVGGVLATAPAVLAAIPQGWTVTLVVAVAMLLYQEVESRILVPRIYGRVLRLSPASVIFALLVGGTLMGIIGALLALPFAAALQMVFRELRVEMPGEAAADPTRRAIDANAEHRYEVLSHGLPAQDASSIATEMAHDEQAASRPP
jgi:putative heme transporter